jgi:hypothetical protein
MDATIKTKRAGRPVKRPKRGQRSQLNVLVPPRIKLAITKRARENGRTVSKEAEFWFEQLLAQERLIKLDDAGFRAEMRRRGYTPVHGSPRNEWALLPEGSRSGFIPPDEEDQS